MSNFNGNEGTFIQLGTASDWTKKYRDENEGQAKGIFYGKAKLNELLNQTDCVGIRVYFATDAEGNNQLVLVGAKANKDDITTLVLDMGSRCPDDCSSPNALNS